MRYLLLFGLLLCCSLHGQQVTAQLEIGRKQAPPLFLEYCPSDGGIVYLAYSSTRSTQHVEIVKYDASFTLKWQKPFLTHNGRRRIEFLSVVGERILGFVSEYFPKDGVLRTSFTEFDAEGNVLTELQPIAELPNSKATQVDLDYTLSTNRKVLLAHRNLNEQRLNERILAYEFFADSDEVIASEIKLPYEDKDLSVKSMRVANDGNIYILAKYYKVSRIQNPDDYQFILYRFNPDTDNMDEFIIPMDGFYISDLEVRIDRHGNMILAGFFSNRSDENIIGVCSYQISANGIQGNISRQKFSDDFLSKFMSIRQVEKEKELSNFYLDQLILRSDGGLIMTAEMVYTTYYSSVDLYGYWFNQVVYHYDEVICISVDSAGIMEWSAIIDKQQAGTSTNRLGYLPVAVDASLYFVFESTLGKWDEICLREITETGEVSETQPLLEPGETERFILPRGCRQISANEMLMVYEIPKKKVHVIAKVAF